MLKLEMRELLKPDYPTLNFFGIKIKTQNLVKQVGKLKNLSFF